MFSKQTRVMFICRENVASKRASNFNQHISFFYNFNNPIFVASNTHIIIRASTGDRIIPILVSLQRFGISADNHMIMTLGIQIRTKQFCFIVKVNILLSVFPSIASISCIE